MSEESILVIGTSEDAAEVASTLSSESWTVATAPDLTAAREAMENSPQELIVLDTASVAEPPWRVMEILRESGTEPAILLLVAPTTEWSSFSTYRQRPAALVLKPLDRNALLMAVDSALVYRRLLEENRTLKRQLGSAISLSDWVGCTPESLEVRKSIATAALSTGTLTLIGEDGTGRRLAAELVHRHGRNPGSTFLPIDLTSLPAGGLRRLLEEVRDAADSGGASYVRGARPGTLYLAELTALAPEDQTALEEILAGPLPFRLMASAVPSIRNDVRQGRFDPGAFRAVSEITIDLPPLRGRRADVPVLIDYFLKKFCERLELRPLGIPSSAIESYSNYDWPGNVAELSMMIERAVSIASAAKFDGKTLPEHFCSPPSLTMPASDRLRNVSLRDLIADIEKRIILKTLERVEGSQKRAAEELRLNPTTLHEKMKRYKILPDRGGQGV